jgi:tetratricopeptide (TPR) repeat protein
MPSALVALPALALVTCVAAGRRLSVTSAVLAVLAVGLAYSGLRHFGVEAWVCLVILARESRVAASGPAGRMLTRWGSLGGGKARVAYRTLVVLALIGGAWHLWTRGIVPERRPGLGVDLTQAPVGAVRFIEQVRLRGPMFNMYNQGAYLIWKLPPREKIFIDGLNAYSMSWMKYYYQVIDTQEDPARLVSRWKLQYALLDEQQLAAYRNPYGLIAGLSDLGWQMVYYDGRDMIYVADTPAHRDLIARYGYRYLRWPGINRAHGPQDLEAVKAEIRRMVASDPQSPHAHDSAAWLLASLGDAVGAEQEYHEEARLSRNPSRAYFGLGALYAALGENDRAIDYYRQGIRWSPREPGGHRQLADLYHRMGRFEDAIRERRRTIRAQPRSGLGHYDLARTYHDAAIVPGAPKDLLLRRALKEFEVSYRLRPRAEVSYALGRVYLGLEDPPAAVLEFKRAIALDPKVSGGYAGLAEAQEAVGDRAAAVKSWQRALADAVDDAAATRARERLRALQAL